MQTAFTGQANIVELPIVAKESCDPIVSGVVNFYLVDKDGPNAGKWYRGSDGTWQVAEASAGEATHRADGHWYRSIPSAVWTRGVKYRLYAKEAGSLHITVGEDVLVKMKDVDRILKAWAAGNVRLKSGETSVYEYLDADDGSTVIVEMQLSQTTPFRTVTLKI